MKTLCSKKSCQIRRTRSDAQMRTIEKMYGKDFGVKSDKQLSDYLRSKGYQTLNKLLKIG